MDVEVKKDKAQTYLKDHEVKELIKKSQDGDQAARDLIAEKNMRLVWSVVQRFLIGDMIQMIFSKLDVSDC